MSTPRQVYRSAKFLKEASERVSLACDRDITLHDPDPRNSLLSALAETINFSNLLIAEMAQGDEDFVDPVILIHTAALLRNKEIVLYLYNKIDDDEKKEKLVIDAMRKLEFT